jgi:glycosyltransferase involved in cell wall biosynthesis
MSAPRISIVLPTYNRAEYLPQALDSCISQTFTDWEVIVVDDASTDDTPRIIKSYCACDVRVRTIRHGVNRRRPSALNTGFRAARGHYFTWTSDDNLYRPAALAEMLAFIEAHGVDLVYADYSVINARGEIVRPACIRRFEDLVLVNVVGACFLYKREVHAALGGYSAQLFLAEDYDFWLRASASFRFGYLQKDLYLYRSHERSLYETRAPEVKIAHAEALFRTLPRLEWMSAELRCAAYAHLITLGEQRGDIKAARKYARLALRHQPLSLMRLDTRLLARLLCPDWLQPAKARLERAYWRRRARRAASALVGLVRGGERIVLLDAGTLGPIDAHNAIMPFTEADGQYNGLPRDDHAAAGELQRLRDKGASFFAVAWPAFWCMTYYKAFFSQVGNQYRCVCRNRDLVIFDLRETLVAPQDPE